MGLSFFLERYRGSEYVGHTGSQQAFFSFFYIDRQTGAGAIACLLYTSPSPRDKF